MFPIPDTQHNHKWAAALTKSKPDAYGHLDELKTFTPMYGYGLDGPVVRELYELLSVSSRNAKAMLQAMQCALLTLAQCAENASESAVYGFVHRRGTNRTKAIKRYKERAFNDEQLTKALDVLEARGYVRYEKGFRGEGMPKGLSTLWFVAERFYADLADDVRSLCVVSFTEQAEVLVLKSDGDAAGLVDYEDDEHTNAMRQRIVLGNAQRAAHEWTYMPLDRELWDDGVMRRGRLKKEYRQFQEGDVRELVQPESLECRRVFKGDFESGGRFYCGAQSLNKSERATIWIDGEPTLELDLKSLHPRLLYNLAGSEGPEDCYHADTPEQRVRNKKIFMYLANSKDRSTAKRAFIADFGGTGETADAEFQTYIDQHPKIAHHFFRSGWKTLQFMDSQIVDAVLVAAMEHEVAVLPVHDSFIVKTRDIAWLHGVIIECYRELTGFEPVLDWEQTRGADDVIDAYLTPEQSRALKERVEALREA